jgi:hypothetical protein
MNRFAFHPRPRGLAQTNNLLETNKTLRCASLETFRCSFRVPGGSSLRNRKNHHGLGPVRQGEREAEGSAVAAVDHLMIESRSNEHKLASRKRQNVVHDDHRNQTIPKTGASGTVGSSDWLDASRNSYLFLRSRNSLSFEFRA